MPALTDRVYLGDGLYAWFDGEQIWLAASDGVEDTDSVALNEPVLRNFLYYVQHLDRAIEARREAERNYNV